MSDTRDDVSRTNDAGNEHDSGCAIDANAASVDVKPAGDGATHAGADASHADDAIARPVLHRLLRRIIIGSAVALACVCVVGIISGWTHDGLAGMHAAVIGSIIVLLFSGTTPATFAVLSRKHLSMKQFVNAVLVSWVVKIVIVFGSLIALRSATWFSHHVFALVIFAGTIAVLIVEWACVFASEFAAAGLRSGK